MPDETKPCQLIVRQRPVAHPELDILLDKLKDSYGLDTYTARQRLIGSGLALLGRGTGKQTARIAELLQLYGFACWLIEKQKPAFAPDMLRSLEKQGASVVFTCQKESVRLERGDSVVGVLADLSGGLADKHVKRLLARNAYRGSNALGVLSHEEMVRTIFQGQPIFDFYLLADDGRIRQAVRVLPGRFNVDGLGARASISSTQNLQALITLVEEVAGSFRMHCDFGLSQLPGCIPSKVADSPSALMENLASLNRYGWLVCQLRGDGGPAEALSSGDRSALAAAGLTAGGTLTGITSSALPAADGALAPGLTEMAAEAASTEVTDELSAVDDDASVRPDGRRDLPSPPEPPPVQRRWSRVALMTGAAAAGFLAAAGGNGKLLEVAARYGWDTGTLPALAALVLCWGGLYCLRLKRCIENTPTSKVRSVAMGQVEVHGRARRRYALVAPMTQAACVWYRLRKYRKTSKNNWKLVREINSSHVPFVLDDGTGQVTIDPQGAAVRAKVQQSGYPGRSPLTFTAFREGVGEDEKWLEDIIYEGTSLYVLGFARPVQDMKLTLRERTLARLRQVKLDPASMRRYDTNSDGRIDQAEWEDARADAERQALAEHLAERSERKRQEEHVMIGRPPQRGLPFIIAETVSEGQLTRKYGWIGLLTMAAGLIAGAAAVYKLLQYLTF